MSQQPVTAEDLYLYAMQLLEPEEQTRLEAFLQQSPEARAELARVRGDLSFFAMSVDQQAPSPLTRQRLLKQVAREKKANPAAAATPVPTHVPAQTRQHMVPAEAEANEGLLTPIQDTYTSARTDTPLPFRSFTQDEDEDDYEEPRRGIFAILLPWAGWAVAAGLAVSTYDIYHRVSAMQDQLNFANARVAQVTASSAKAQQVLETLRSGNSQRFTLTKQTTAPAPMARVAYLAEAGTLVFQANNLEQLPPFKTYELWLIPAGEGRAPIPAGTFKPDERGYATVIVPELPKGVLANNFGVTMEDDGGSQQPTMPILMIGS